MAKNPMSCGAQCSRITLSTLNVIFLLCGLALLILGLVFRFGGSELKEDIKNSFEKVEVGDYDFYGLVNSLAVLFIIVGAIIIVFSVLGFVGAVCYVQWALVLYAILIGICLIIELAGVILFFTLRNKFEEGVQEGLEQQIEEANKGNSDFKKSTEYMFKTFECCHVNQKRLNETESCGLSAESFNKDCFEAIKDWLRPYQGAFIGVGITVMVVEILLIVLAIWICRASAKKENLA